MKSESRVDQLITRLKNNPILAILIIFGLAVISIGSFTDALTRIAGMVPKVHQPDVTGYWRSEALKDIRTNLEFAYTFDLKADDAHVYGTARRLIPYCEAHTQSGICGGYNDGYGPVGIRDGHIDGKSISFSCFWEALPGGSSWSWVNVQEKFHGTLKQGRIVFVQQDDQNSPAMKFIATKEKSAGK
jgi:hypothetical protein